MTWVQTYSGRAFSLLNPQATDVVFEDIARHLAYTHRFNGITNYTNAQHSLLVASIVWQVTKSKSATIHGLLHDAHEAYMGDIIGPMRAALKAMLGEPFKQALGQITTNIDAVIREAFNLHDPAFGAIAQVVTSADQRALFIERQMFLADPPAPWPGELSSYDETYRVAHGGLRVEWNKMIMTRKEAQEAFTYVFEELRHRLDRGPKPQARMDVYVDKLLRDAFSEFQH